MTEQISAKLQRTFVCPRFDALTRFPLKASVINFALAALSVVIREIHEVRVDVMDVTEDRAAASQKRWGYSVEMNVAGKINARSSDSDY